MEEQVKRCVKTAKLAGSFLSFNATTGILFVLGSVDCIGVRGETVTSSMDDVELVVVTSAILDRLLRHDLCLALVPTFLCSSLFPPATLRGPNRYIGFWLSL